MDLCKDAALALASIPPGYWMSRVVITRGEVQAALEAYMLESERRAQEPLHLFLNATEMRLYGERFKRWHGVVVHAAHACEGSKKRTRKGRTHPR